MLFSSENNFNVIWICLLVWSLSSHTRIFHSYGNVTIAGEVLKILTYARHSWPLSSEGSLACHTHCDTWSSPRTRDTHLMPSVWQWSCHYLSLRLRSVATRDQTRISPMPGERSTSTPRRRYVIWRITANILSLLGQLWV